MSDISLADLNTCESEPIHIPSAIQPQGYLIAVSQAEWIIRYLSANCASLFQRDIQELIGRPANEIFDAPSLVALRSALQAEDLSKPIALSLSLQEISLEPRKAHAHVSRDMVVVELVTEAESSDPPLTFTTLRRSIGELLEAGTSQELLDLTVQMIREFTGYDRVLIYRFNADWNGEVVAESRHGDLEAYMGLHFPASDIPAQARELYLHNRLRVIPDARYVPVAVVPNGDGNGQRPLDMSSCLLRSVSPVHLEYLANMNVQGTLTISLTHENRLWGLIACHHRSPKNVSFSDREFFATLGQVVSSQLVMRAEMEDQATRIRLGKVLERISQRLARPGSFLDNLLEDESDFLALAEATGAVIWHYGRSVRIGSTPPLLDMVELIAWIKQQSANPVFSTTELSKVYGSGVDARVASGLLSLQISRDPDVILLWFRPEVIQTVLWAGDPSKSVESTGADGRLHPRHSFSLWKQAVQGTSTAWRPEELDVVTRLRLLVLEAGSRSAIRLEGLLPICAWCKKIRDEPGYWREVDEYVSSCTKVRFSHGICPDCFEREMSKSIPSR